MSTKVPDIGMGTALTFDSGFCSRLLDVDIADWSRAFVETTTMATAVGTGKTFMPCDVYTPPTLTATIQFASDDAPPLTSDPETVTIAFPDGNTISASGFMTTFEVTVRMEEVSIAKIGLKLTGSVSQS